MRGGSSAFKLSRELPGWLNGTLILGTFAAILWLEKRRPLRRQTENKLHRDLRNLAMAALSASAIHLTERPITARLTRWVDRRKYGLVKYANLPTWAEVLASVVLLDYTLYIWHVLTHKVPFLWRLHAVHHADLDLSASTAVRFHFAEMALSVPWRAAQVVLIGAPPLSLSVWQTLTLLAILFHHSNVELPLETERWLCRLVTTPRMHGIHHSVMDDERDSNWSTILSFPDYLHGTVKLNIPQKQIIIGVPEEQNPDQLTLGKLMLMPLIERRSSLNQVQSRDREDPAISIRPTQLMA